MKRRQEYIFFLLSPSLSWQMQELHSEKALRSKCAQQNQFITRRVHTDGQPTCCTSGVILIGKRAHKVITEIHNTLLCISSSKCGALQKAFYCFLVQNKHGRMCRVSVYVTLRRDATAASEFVLRPGPPALNPTASVAQKLVQVNPVDPLFLPWMLCPPISHFSPSAILTCLYRTCEDCASWGLENTFQRAPIDTNGDVAQKMVRLFWSLPKHCIAV